MSWPSACNPTRRRPWNISKDVPEATKKLYGIDELPMTAAMGPQLPAWRAASSNAACASVQL